MDAGSERAVLRRPRCATLARVADEVTVLQAPPRHTLEELAERARRPLEAAGTERAVVFAQRLVDAAGEALR